MSVLVVRPGVAITERGTAMLRGTIVAGLWVLLAALPSPSEAAADDQKPPLITFLGAASDGSLTHPVGAVVDLSLPFSVTEARKPGRGWRAPTLNSQLLRKMRLTRCTPLI